MQCVSVMEAAESMDKRARVMREINFTCVGYHIRTPSIVDFPTADCTEWEDADELIEDAYARYGLLENELQLISPRDEKEYQLLIDIVSSKKNCSLIAIALLESTIDALQKKGLYKHRDLYMDESSISMGVDVCDFNGFFSLLHMTNEFSENRRLFYKSEIQDALELALKGAILIPEHSPFVLAEIFLCYSN